MRSWTLKLAALSFPFLASLTAQADIVFVNMNRGAKEIAAAAEAATQMGEYLYVLPEQDQKQYSVKDLTEDLLRLAEQGVRPRTMIVSGHHVSNQDFFGSNGRASINLIYSMLPWGDDATSKTRHKMAFEFFSGIKSLYLWGCYTGTLQNTLRILDNRNTVFSNAKLIFGFAEKGPLSTNPISGQTLKTFLLNEKSFHETSNENLLPMIQSLVPSNAYNAFDFIVHRDTIFASKAEGVNDRATFEANCRSREKVYEISAAAKLILAYYNNEAGPLPDPTTGELRKAYNVFQRNRFCVEDTRIKVPGVSVVPTVPMAIRLVHYRNVIKNFSRIYTPHLKFAFRQFEKAGLNEAEFITRLDQIERGQAIAQLKNLEERIQTVDSSTDVEQKARFIYLTNAMKNIFKVVYPDPDIIPQSWVDQGSVEPAHLPTLNDAPKAMEDSLKEAQKALRR